MHHSEQLPWSLKYSTVAQASIQDRGTQLSILQDTLLMWQGAGQAGTFGMTQLALPEGHKRKAEAEMRVLSLWQLPGSSTVLTGEEGKKGRGENKTQKAQSGNCYRGKWRWKRSKAHCSEGENKGLMVFVQGEGP